MDKNAVVEIVDRFRRGLEARGIRPQKVILYGSHATGVDTAASDIDVVVISSDFFGFGSKGSPVPVQPSRPVLTSGSEPTGKS